MDTDAKSTEDHLRDDERRSDGGSAPRAGSCDRARPTKLRSHASDVHQRPAGRAAEQFDDRSPIDTRILLGRFQKGTREQAREAIAAARRAYPAWSALALAGARRACCGSVADAIRAHRWELSALMGYEAGKNRLECVGDVEESADLIAYYCDQVEQQRRVREADGRA